MTSVTDTTNIENMVTETTKEEDEQLLPRRHPQLDLFICDVADAVLKDLMPQMEHPFYSLSKKPETSVRRYEHNGNWLEITPSVKGLATIYDKDILIYCISQIMHKYKNGEEISKRVRINSYDLLIFTNRGTSGRDYKALSEALERIRGTTISTNIRTGDEEQLDTFGLIESSSIRRKHGLDGRLLWCEVTLSDWVFNAIREKEVLTLHRDYFRLKKPVERRVYEIARKHCGRKESWRISLSLLQKKTGSQSPEKRFRQMLKNLAKYDHLPDYRVEFDGETDQVIFHNREKWWEDKENKQEERFPILDTDTFIDAKKVAPNYDIYFLEQEWKNWWVESGRPPLSDPDKAFIGFCSARYKKNPNP